VKRTIWHESRTRGLALIALAGSVMLAGCATRGRLAQDVAQARADAAQRWVFEKPVEEGMEALFEGDLSLDEAVGLALQHNKTLLTARQEVRVARGKVLESYGVALPHVNALANYTRLDEVPSIGMGSQTIPLGYEDNYSVQVNAAQPLFHGHAIPSALRVAKLYALWSEESIRAATQGVIFQAAKSYYDALLAQTLLQVRQQAEQLAEALLKDVQQKRAAGVVSDYDVLRAEVEVSNARAARLQQKNELDLAMTQLLKTLGISQKSRVRLVGTLTHKPESAELAAAMATALEKRPELYQAEYSLRMQEESLKIAKSAYWPQIDAFLTQKWANPDPHRSTRDEWGDAWTAGVSASWPIFDGLARHGKVVQEKARLEQARTELVNRQETVALEVRQALYALQNAEELVQSQRMNLQRAEEGLRLVQAGYREGVKTELDVLDAQTALTQTRALYHQALHAHTLARANLRKATGILDEDWKALVQPEVGAPPDGSSPSDAALKEN
jgi:outer membrane protein